MTMGLVYFMEAPEAKKIKIGFSGDVDARLATLQTWCPFALRTITTVKTYKAAELYCHYVMAAHWVRGEWFEAHPFVLNFIDTIRREGKIPGLPQALPKVTGNLWERSWIYRLDNLIPRIWPTRAVMAAEMGVKTFVADPFNPWPGYIRIVLAARARGFNLRAADVVKCIPKSALPETKPRVLKAAEPPDELRAAS